MMLDGVLRHKTAALLPVVAQQYAILLGCAPEDVLEVWAGSLHGPEAPAKAGVPGVAPAAPPAAATVPAQPPATRPRRPKLKDWVRVTHAEHPEWTIREIARHLGRTVPTVQRHADAMNLKVPKIRASSPPAARHVAGSRFRLADPQTGKFLHQDLSVSDNEHMLFTNHPEFAWCGTESQLTRVRELLPASIDLELRVVLP